MRLCTDFSKSGMTKTECHPTSKLERISGVINPMKDTEESLSYATYFGTSVWTHIKQRSIVLIVLLLLQSLSSVVLSRYQGLLERNVFLALFLTMLTGTGGNAGNQSSALIIRGLSTGEINSKNSWQVMCLILAVRRSKTSPIDSIQYLDKRLLAGDVTARCNVVCLWMLICTTRCRSLCVR